MTMKDNYLWDRTGEVDAEVQQLEELLGSLRYQPKPLEIPATISLRRKRPFIPLAIAAAIAVLMIGAGLWVRFAKSNPGRTEQAKTSPQPTAPPPQELPAQRDVVAVAPGREVQPSTSPNRAR